MQTCFTIACIWENINLLTILTIKKLIFESLFEYLDEQKLLSEHQCGFRPNNSCANQLLSIAHDIYAAFDADPTLEVRGLFLDFSKAFDKAWHKGLIYKLRQVGISGKALALISSFLNNRFQRVILNGQSSNWSKLVYRRDLF